MQITLPLPPSANRIWRNMRGTMVKSAEYRAWKDAAALAVAHQVGGATPLRHFSVLITLPETRRDPDNSVKPILDALQAGGVIADDKLLRSLTLTVDSHRQLPSALIHLDAADAPPSKPKARRARKVRA
jgi:crossover junction endodeoxyribonuclease RusA